MIRHVLGPLLMAASPLLLTGCKGVDYEKPPTRSNVAFAGATHRFDGTYANPQWLG